MIMTAGVGATVGVVAGTAPEAEVEVEAEHSFPAVMIMILLASGF